MSVTNDMVASLRRPGHVMEKHLSLGVREDRALIYLMASCVMFFVANLPVMARNAHLNGSEMGPELGASVLAWLFVAPLALYIVAGVLRIIVRIFGCKAGWYPVRLAFFWSLLVSTPLVLLNGLTAGMIGPGVQQNTVGFLWFVCFLWVLIGSMRAACRPSE